MPWSYCYCFIGFGHQPLYCKYQFINLGSLLKIPIWSMLDKTKCSIAITYDNLLNGNISINDSNSYFTGTVMADNAMKNITN